MLALEPRVRYKLRWSPIPGTTSGTQLSFSSSWGRGELYSLVCLILNLLCSLWPGDRGKAAWPTHTGQDLSPMCARAQSELCLPGLSVFPSQGPARGTRVSLLPFGTEHGAQPGCSRRISPGKTVSEGHSGNQATFSPSAHQDAWMPSGAAGLKGAQRTDPTVSARTCPPAKGRSQCSLSAGQLNKALRGEWFCPPRNDPCSGLCLGK